MSYIRTQIEWKGSSGAALAFTHKHFQFSTGLSQFIRKIHPTRKNGKVEIYISTYIGVQPHKTDQRRTKCSMYEIKSCPPILIQKVVS